MQNQVILIIQCAAKYHQSMFLNVGKRERERERRSKRQRTCYFIIAPYNPKKKASWCTLTTTLFFTTHTYTHWEPLRMRRYGFFLYRAFGHTGWQETSAAVLYPTVSFSLFHPPEKNVTGGINIMFFQLSISLLGGAITRWPNVNKF